MSTQDGQVPVKRSSKYDKLSRVFVSVMQDFPYTRLFCKKILSIPLLGKSV